VAVAPFISCLMVTRAGRETLAASAVADWQAQTHPKRELMIVADNPIEFYPFTRDDVRISVVQAPPGATIGALRQLSVEKSCGDAIAIWDDDDGHHARRLEEQAVGLAYGDVVLLGKVMLRCVCGYTVTSRQHGWEPTMLVHRDVLPQYEDVTYGEDTAIVRALWNVRRARFEQIVAPELYEYRFHGGNACAVDHWQGLFATVSTHDPWRCAAQRGLTKPEADATLDEIKARIGRATDTPALARCARAVRFYTDHHPAVSGEERIELAWLLSNRQRALTRPRPLGDPHR